MLTMKIFITGTDTEIGKTTVCCYLLKKYQQQGLSTLGLKPVASGCYKKNKQLVNDDALQLAEHSTIKLAYDLINPIQLQSPVSPNIAACNEGISLTADHICQQLSPSLQVSSDVTLIEGIGGWLVPINPQQTMADVVYQLSIPVILVVGVRLGCINHALLTQQAMLQKKVDCLGWIANQLDPDERRFQENIMTLKKHVKYPLIDCVSFMSIENSLISQ